MGLKLIWTGFAINQLENVYDYYNKIAGKAVAKRVVNVIYKAPAVLKDLPELGQIEELLIDRDQEFRYILCKHHKIIYWLNVNQKRIEVVDVFDTRQNPTKIIRNN
ncbi:type II toxin-antitoxin system RelE/ParE family toxin [uncultured Marivirga sp.]|uniref:type II toxin-antitoxin system RelE/ParE family toxin n=1 Tax=uncultured Marivirga sp. TaxID=1123707 RepID=UPI0030EDD7F0|tara:strand:+ start:135186 stop:135503 length:318 start_codon:yes stop_codon:yes gene_type:complete